MQHLSHLKTVTLLLIACSLFGASLTERRVDKAVEDFIKAREDLIEVLDKAEEKAERDEDQALLLSIRKERARLLDGAEVEAGAAAPELSAFPTTAEGWDALRGIEIKVLATVSETQVPGLVLQPGQKINIIPHPDDRWQGTINGVKMDYTGSKTASSTAHGEALRSMAMLVKIGETVVHASDGPHEGSGRVSLLVNDTGLSDNMGSIRVKIVAVP